MEKVDLSESLSSMFPPVTPVCFASMYSGLEPQHHGIMKYEKQFIGYILCLPIMFYEQESQKEYMKQIRKMTEHFSTTLKDDTARFLKPFSGAAK